MKLSMRRQFGLLLTVLLLIAFTGCGNSGNAKQVEITLWTWQSTIKDFTSAFEKQHPNIHINVVNAGTNDDEYMQLSNAIEANSGVPDVVYMDYNAVQQFAVSNELRNLADFGFNTIAKDYTDSSLAAVSSNGKHYALPISAGPMVMFYNTKVFAKAGIEEPPATWEDFELDAHKIAALGKDTYITNDDGDAGHLNSMIWQAGARPYSVNGDHLVIDLSSSKVKKFTSMWQPLIDQDLVDTSTKSWSQDWYQGLSEGHIATILTGAWMTTTLKRNLPKTSGDWRISTMPQYANSQHTNSENGGGALALPASADEAKAKAAYEFAKWYAHEDGVDINLKQDGIPPLRSVLTDKDYLQQTDSFFGGQQTHQVIAQAAQEVDSDWQYLPYMAYANQIAVNSIGQAYLHKTTLLKALGKWGADLTDYGRSQGFTVTNKTVD